MMKGSPVPFFFQLIIFVIPSLATSFTTMNHLLLTRTLMPTTKVFLPKHFATSNNHLTKINPKSYNIKTTGSSSKSETLTSTNFTISSDVPKSQGGSNTAPQPVGLLLASLTGCSMATATFVGRNWLPKLIIEKIDFDLDGVRDQRGSLTLPISEDPGVPSRLASVMGLRKLVSRFCRRGKMGERFRLRRLGGLLY